MDNLVPYIDENGKIAYKEAFILPELDASGNIQYSENYTVESGIKINAVDVNDFPTDIDLIGNSFQKFLLYNYSTTSGGWHELTTVSFLNEITKLTQSMFQNCNKLNFSSLQDTINSIEARCFYGCSALTLAALPAKVHSLDYQTFYNCVGLTQMRLGGVGNAVSSISASAFEGCTNITDIVVYTAGGAALADQPWGATGADVTYMEA